MYVNSRKYKINNRFYLNVSNQKNRNVSLLKRRLNDSPKSALSAKEKLKKNSSTKEAAVKNKKDPVPMKFRAFPRSFWQQPNRTPPVSPGVMYFLEESFFKQRKNKFLVFEKLKRGQEMVTQPNIDLLFSLFQNVEEQRKNKNDIVKQRRRPAKLMKGERCAHDDDPYLTTTATHPFLNLLTEKGRKNLKMLPAMSSNNSISNVITTEIHGQNYNKILSDLVVQL
ncbi:hypothetical protein FQA39_LY01326 [Lamprigera yunnana]|nr:hypothetical protein FQA39_LY01326 [Lamprigera yunnana]